MSLQSNSPQPIRLLLGVSGGIAAYKSAELVRRLKERDFDVRVVMTSAASHFVTEMTLQAVSGYPVHHELFDKAAEAAMSHIELAKWADLILIAPATANIIAKIAHGIADDLLTTIILASQAELIIAPSMNQQMWINDATRSNVKLLKEREVTFFGPDSGEQACGDIGFGRMLEPLTIVDRLEEKTAFDGDENQFLKGKKVIITAGPTLEAIDPVRYISNHSSGKMGYALAQAAIEVGADVILISGPVNLLAPVKACLRRVISAADMFNEVVNCLPNCDLFIGCAAVADYTPEMVAEQKLKKNNDKMALSLKKTNDIIAWVAEQDRRPFVVGFAAESQNLQAFAQKKLENKNLDMICANDISDENTGFNSDNNKLLILDKKGKNITLTTAPKKVIAKKIIEEISQRI